MAARVVQSRRRPMSQINVVPFIDVMLVLLIIFMVTAPLLQQGIEVELPEAAARPMPPDEKRPDPLVITVDREGALSVNVGPRARESLEIEDLSAIAADYIGTNPEAPVYVRGDRGVAYGRVVEAMVLLQQAGADKVGLITDPEPQGRKK